MLLTSLLYAFATILVVVLKEIILTIIRNHEAHKFFKKHSPNLPVAPGLDIFGGHSLSVIWVKKNWKKAIDLHKKYGKIVGLFYCDKPAVLTTDLDLVKTIVLDNPNDHNDRMSANTPVEEVEKDSIMTCTGDQWRRIRRAVAPAFT